METRGIIAVALVLILFCSTSSVGAAHSAESEPTISINAPEAIEPGESTTVEVRVSSSTPVYAVQFTINYGDEPIQASTLTKGPYLGNQTISVANEITATSIEFGQTRVATSEGVKGTGTVASFIVSVPEDTNADSFSLTFTTAKVANPDAKPIPVTTKNVTVQISPASSQQGNANAGNTADRTTATATITGDQSVKSTSGSTGTTGTTGTITSSPTEVDSAVRDALATTDTAQVRIEIANSQTLTSMVPVLERAGARNISTENGSVIATISNQSLQELKQMSGIQSVTHAGASDVSSPARNSTEIESSSTESSPTSMTNANSSESPPENEPTQGVTTPGFSLATAVLALCSVALLCRLYKPL